MYYTFINLLNHVLQVDCIYPYKACIIIVIIIIIIITIHVSLEVHQSRSLSHSALQKYRWYNMHWKEYARSINVSLEVHDSIILLHNVLQKYLG